MRLRFVALLILLLTPFAALAEVDPTCQPDSFGRVWCLKNSLPAGEDTILGFSIHGVVWFVIAMLVLLVIAIMVWSLAIGPRWNVWQSHQSGLADLALAKNEQQIQIAKAQSRLDAAELNKKAAIVEAEAVAEQIDRIGAQLTTHDLYLRWQWIKMMEDTHSEKDQRTVVYVPTEANIPIMEARRKT